MQSNDKNEKILSIITVCLNEPDLARTCESIVNQTFQSFEWIVVDGGSNLETQSVWDKYRHRVDYFVSEKDSGIYNAMNKGIRASSGRWLNFMNAGDFFYSNSVLEKLSDIFINDNFSTVVFGKAKMNDRRGVYISNKKILNNDYRRFFYHDMLPHQSTFIRNEAFQTFGYYDESLKIIADWKFFALLAKNKKVFRYVENIISCMNMDGISVTNATLSRQEKMSCIPYLYTSDEIKEYEKDALQVRVSNMVNRVRARVVFSQPYS